MDMNIRTTDFSIHDIMLRFNTDSGLISSSISEFLECFQAEEILGSTDITVSLFDLPRGIAPGFSVPEDSKLLYEPSETDMFDISILGISHLNLYVDEDGSTYYADFGDLGGLQYSPKQGTATGHIHTIESDDSSTISRFVFSFAMDKLLEARGCFAIHCSAVEKNGKGIIFPGFSGAGKTTACIALIRRGYGFLGDDRPFLQYSKNGNLELLSFPEYIDVTDETVYLFPELKEKNCLVENRHLRKKSFNAEDRYPGSIRMSCTPKAIIYPEISKSKKSYLEKLSKSDTLKSLLPHSLLVFDKDIAKKHFDILFDLVKSTDCYKLKFGANIHELPELMESIF